MITKHYEYRAEDLQRFDGWNITAADDSERGTLKYAPADATRKARLVATWQDGTTSNIYAVVDDHAREFTGYFGQYDAKIFGDQLLKIC